MTEIGPTDGYKKVLGATKDEYLKTMEVFFRTLSVQVGYKVGGLKRSSFYDLWHEKYSDYIVSSSSLHGIQPKHQTLQTKKNIVQTTEKRTENHNCVIVPASPALPIATTTAQPPAAPLCTDYHQH